MQKNQVLNIDHQEDNMEERNELIKELFELHKLLADKGEISIGYGFSENYDRLKDKVEKLTTS